MAKAKRGSSSYQETGAARAVVAAYQEEVEKAKQAANTAGTGVDYKTVNRQAYETAYNSNAAYRQQVNDNASAILSKYINDDGSWKENTQIDRDMAALNNTAKNQEAARQQRQAQQLQSLKDLIAQATESEGRQNAIRTALENKDTDLQGAIDQYDKALKASKRTSAAVDDLRKELQDLKGKQSTVRNTRAKALPKQTEDTADLGRITSAADVVDRNRVAAAKGEAAQTASKLNDAISKMNAAYQSYAKATSSNDRARTQMNYQAALRAYIDALDANNSAQVQYASLTNLFQAQEDYAQAHPAETRKILETARGIGVSGSTRTGQPIRNSQTALNLQNAAAALDNYGKARVQELLGATQRGASKVSLETYEAYRKNVEAAAALEAQAKAKLKEADKYLKSNPSKFKKLQKEADKLQAEAEGYRAKADEISGGDASFAQQGEAASMAADAKADPDFKYLSEAGEKRTFVPRLRSMSGQAESVREQNDWQTRSITGSNTTVRGYIDAMTEEQRKVYYYYVGRGETDKAQEYFSALEPSLETGYSAAMTERMQGIAEEHPVAMTGLTAVLNNTAAPVQGVIAAAQNVANKDKWAVPMTAGAGYTASDTAQGTQKGVSADIQKATGFSENTSDFLSGVILSTATSIVGSQLWGNVYGAALTSGITGGAVVPAMNETIPLVVMGTEAFSEAYREQIRDGKDPAYSLLYSGAAGYVEYLTEKIGMDDLVNGLMSGGSATRLARRLGLGLIDVDGRLVSTAKSSIVRTLHTWLVGSASSVLSEGGEEIMSEAADTLLDVVLNGDRSEMGKQFNAYLAEGDDANVALRKCFKDFGLNIAEAFAGGAISGGIMSIPGIFSSASNSNALGQAVLDAQGISGNALNWAEYVSEALTMDQNTRTYQIAKQIYDADQATKNYMPSASEMTNLILASKVDAEQAARSQAKLDKIQARELRRTEQAEAKAERRSGGSKTSTQVTDLGEIGTQVKNLGVDAKTAQNVERMMGVVHSGESLTDANIRSLPLNNTKVMEYVADLLGYGNEIKDIGTFRAAVQTYNDTHETTTAQAETARNMISQVNESMPTIKKAAYDRADTEATETLRTAQQAATQAAEQARQARTTQAQNAAAAMGARVQSQAAQLQAEAKTTETATEPEGVKHRAKAAGYNYGDFSELMQSFHPDMGSDEIVQNFNDVADGKKTLLDVIGRDGIRKFAEEAAGRSVTDEEVDQIAAAYALSGEDGTNIRQSIQEQLDHVQEQGKRGFRYSKENPNLLAEWMVDRVKRNLFEGYDVNVEVRYDLEDGAGNGYYDAGTNTIVINGQIREGRHGGVTYNAAANLTYVVSHEFFHRYLNPTSVVEYTPEIKARMDNVLETYRQARGWAQNDLDNFVQRHYETYMAQARKDQRRIRAGESVENALNPDKITLDYAKEESAADLGAEMLQNYGVMKRMASVGPTFLEALKNSMTAARRTIQNLVQKGDDADAVLGQQTLDGVDMIMSMLDDVLPERTETLEAGSGNARLSLDVDISEYVTDEAIQNSIQRVSNMDSVAELSGDEFTEHYGTPQIKDDFNRFVAEQGGVVDTKTLGEVILNKRGVHSDLGHGLTPLKATSFAAIPDVLRSGEIVDYDSNWKGRGYASVCIAAPVTIAGERYYEGVIVRRLNDGDKFYAHDVLIEKEEVLPSKPGASNDVGPGGKTPSIDIILDRIRSVNQKFSIPNQIYSDNFKNWFGDWENDPANASKVVNEDGTPKVVYHGTARGDRVGNVFLPERATSGPMAYFTDNERIAENYAKDKADTSMAYDPLYTGLDEDWFRTTDADGNEMRLSDVWNRLRPGDRIKVREAAKHVTLDWDEYVPIYDPSVNNGTGNFNIALRENRNDAIKALMDEWLASGHLYGNEADFVEVLKLAGVQEALENIGYGAARYNDPEFRDERVYGVYLNIRNPLVTSELGNDFADGLEDWWYDQDQSAYATESAGADMWDKNSIDVDTWIERLRNDITNGTTHAWTSIPDAVTDYLKEQGYDGIEDQGGKFHDEGHTVYIPFESTQIKSATDNIGTFDRDNPDIRFSLDDLDDDADSAFAMYTQNGVTNRAETGSDFISYDGSLSTARDFKNAFGSEIDTDYLAMRLRQMGEQWDEIADLTARMGEDGISEDDQNRLRELYDTTERMATELAGEIADNGTLERNQGFDQALYQYMRESVENGIRVPPDQANNYAEALGYENYTEMRKGLYGPFRKNVRLVASGSGVNAVTTAGEAADVLFENILNEFPGAFSEEERGAMNPADRFAAIYNAYMRTVEARDAKANPLAGKASDIAQAMTSAFSDRMVQVASGKYDAWRLEREIAQRTAQETEAKRLANQARQVQRQANESDDPELSRQASDLREQAEAARVESLTTDEALQEGLDESGLETMTREQAAKAYLENEAELIEHRKAQNAEKARSTNWNTMTPQERADAVVRQIMDRKNAAPRQRTSKVYSNTYDAVLGEVNMQIDELQANSTYDVVSEKQSIAGAVQNVKNDYTYWYETLPTKDGWGAQDLDTAMLILTRVQAESQRTGDNTEYIRWAKIIKEHGTQGGQFLQAFAKWSRSAVAVAVAGTKIIEDTTLSVSADTDVLEGIQNAIDSTQLTVDQYQARYQDLMKQLAEKKAQLEALLAQKAESRTMDEQARKELEKSKKKLQDTIAQIDKYRVQYETHLKEIEKFQASIAEKLMEKSELSEANKKLMRKLQNLKHRASSLENRINEISGINETLTNAVQSGNLEDMIRRLEARLDALKLSADQAAADRNAAAAAEQRTGHKRKQSERNKLATETTSDVINSENREFLDILDSIVSDPVKQELMSNMIDMAKMIDACSEGDKEAMLDIIEQTLIKRGFKRGISDHMKKRFLKQGFNYLSRYAVSAMVSMAYDVTPRTWAEKASSLQYTAQLGSPKTWLRNVFSNTVFYLTEGVAKMPGSFVDMVTAKAVQGLTKSANASRTVGHAGFTGGTDVIRSGLSRAGQSTLEVRYDVDTGTMKNKYLQNPRKGEAVRDILGSAVGRRTFKMNNGMAPTKNIFKNGARAIGRAISVREMINGYALNVTDEFSKGMIYESMMRQYEALGIVDENNANGRIDRETAEALAAQEMLYATFQDETWLGTLLDAAHNLANLNKPDGRTAFGPGGGKPHQFGAGDLSVKYRGVPGALVTRAAEFTPLGAAYALYNLHAFHQSGYTDAVRQYKWAMGMGRALTGSAIAAFFLLLAKLGLVSRPDDEEDKDIAAQDRAAGIQGTQINWTAFGRVIDQWQAQRDAGVDWKDMKFDQLDTAWQDDDQVGDIGFMDPLAANITLGVEALRLLEDNSLGASSIGASIKTVWDAFSDLSMMDTIQDLVYAIQYYGDDPSGIGRLGGAVLTFAASSATSMIPATVRQLAQGLDNNYRDTRSTNGAVYEALRDVPFIGGERNAKSAQSIVYNVMSTIPGLRSQVPVKTDSYGQPKTYSGDAEPTTADRIANLLNATLNPGRHTKLNISEVYAETRRLYKETGISAVPDRKAPTSESFSGTDLTVKLTGEDREQWMTEVGNRSQEIMLDLMRTDEYKAATDAQKVEMLRDAKNYAAYEGKKALYEKYVTDGSTWSTDTYSKIDGILDLDNPNLNYAAAYRIKNEINGLEADRDSEGETIEGSLENKILDRLFQYEQDYHLDDNTLVDLYRVTRGSASESATNKMRTLINDAGLTFDEIIDIKTAYNTINATGEAGGMKEVDQFARYLRNEGYTDQQMAAIQEQYKYWTMMPQKESSTIAKLTEAGTDYDVAYDYAAGLAQLEPEEGKDSVSKAQKYQYVLQNVTDANDRQALFQALSEGDTTLLNKIDTGLANKLIDGYAATGSTTFININPSNSMTMDKVEYSFSESDMEKYNEAVLNAYAGIANDSISANEQVFDVFRNAAYGAGQVAALANQGNVWSVDDILESGSTASNNMKHYARATIAASQGLDYYEYATCYREVLDAKDVWTKDNNMGYSTEKSYIQSLLVSEYGSSVGNYLYENVFYRS